MTKKTDTPAAAKAAPPGYTCPGCGGHETPVPTDAYAKDTDDNDVRIFECPVDGCEYTKGEPATLQK